VINQNAGAAICPAGLPFGFPRQLAGSGARATGRPWPEARGGVHSPPLRAALASFAASASRLYGLHGRASVLAFALLVVGHARAADSVTVSVGELQRWHEIKAAGGPTFAGNPAWHAHLQFVERELRARGVVDLMRTPIRYRRWHTSDDPAAGQWSLRADGREVPIVSYWAYSGTTGEQGITAPLVRYDRQNPPDDIAGRIVVFDVPALPQPLPAMFKPPAHVYATDDEAPSELPTRQWYQVNYPTRFGRFGEILKQGGAAGGLVIFDLSPARTRGLYTFPLLSSEPVGVPALYLDRQAGETVRAAAEAGRAATLTLRAAEEPAQPYLLHGFLPGRAYGTQADEFVLLVTHTDGPNLTQENGALGIIAIVDHFAKLPQAKRARTLLIVLDPQHYMPGRHLVDWYERYPELAARIVASIGVEQLGQREYVERGEDFVPSGRPEMTLIFAQDNPRLIEMAIAAVQAEQLPRTRVRVPSRGQGQWAGLGDVAVKRRIPGFAISTDMTAYWSTVPGIESFDAELCRRQIGVLARLADGLMTASLPEIAVPRENRSDVAREKKP
jgi:hypothetical protein